MGNYATPSFQHHQTFHFPQLTVETDQFNQLKAKVNSMGSFPTKPPKWEGKYILTEEEYTALNRTDLE